MSNDLTANTLGPIVGSDEEAELAIQCVKRHVKNKRHQKIILQALGQEPYKGQGKNSKHNKYATKRSIK